MPEETGGGDPPGKSPADPMSINQRQVTGGATNAQQEVETASHLAKDGHWITHATFWIQVGLGIIGLFALWIYHGQLVAMQGQLDEMRRSGEQSTEQTWSAIGNINWMARSADWSQKVSQQGIESNARQSQASLQATVNQFRQEQRAWIGAGDVTPGDWGPKTGFPIEITFVNSGKTPAKNVSFSERFICSQAPIKGPLKPEIKKLVQYASADIAPQGTAHRFLGLEATLSNTDKPDQILGNEQVASYYDDITQGRRILYYFGILKYTDAFGNSRQTTYCIYIQNPKSKTTAYCDEFNRIQ